MLIIILLYFSSKGLPSSSTFTLEEGTIYLTSEPNTLEMQDDNTSVLDVYLVSNFLVSSPSFWFTDGPRHSKFCEIRHAWVLKETVAPCHFYKTFTNGASFHKSYLPTIQVEHFTKDYQV